MDQSIGIEFTPKNVEAVTKAFEKIETGVNKVSSLVAAQTAQMGQLNTAVKAGAVSGEQFSTAITNMYRNLDKFVKAGRSGFTEINKQLKEMNKLAQGGFGGVAPKGRAGEGHDILDLIGPGKMILRWKAYSEGLKALHAGIEDLVLGKAREPMMEPMAMLGFLGMTREQGEETEARARLFRKKFPWAKVEVPEYFKMMWEVMSGMQENFPDAKTAVTSMANIADLAGIFARVSKADPEKFTQLFTKGINVSLLHLPDEERKAYQTGKKDVSDLGTEMMGWIATAVKMSHMKGLDIAHLMGYFLPTAFARGMSIPDAMSAFAALTSAGIKPQKVARGLKTIMETKGPNLADLEAAAMEDQSIWNKLQAPGDARRKELYRINRGAELLKSWGKNQLGFLAELIEWSQKAEAKGRPLESFKFGAEWTTIIRELKGAGLQELIGRISGTMPKNLEEAKEAIKAAEAHIQSIAGPETTWTRLTSAWEGMWATWARLAQKSEEIQAIVAGIEGSINKFKGYLEGSVSGLEFAGEFWYTIGNIIVTALLKLGNFLVDTISLIHSTVFNLLAMTPLGPLLKKLGVELGPVDYRKLVEDTLRRKEQRVPIPLGAEKTTEGWRFPVELGENGKKLAEAFYNASPLRAENRNPLSVLGGIKPVPPLGTEKVEEGAGGVLSPAAEALIKIPRWWELSANAIPPLSETDRAELMKRLPEEEKNRVTSIEPTPVDVNVRVFIRDNEIRDVISDVLRQDRTAQGNAWGTNWDW